MKKRALISVSDKNGVVDAAKRLAAMGYEIISTGGTQKCLEDAGLKTLNISDVTGFPECLDGRVKTLHPAVHAGLLAKRDNAEHMRRLKELKIQTIDVVIVNLYPFKQTVMSGKGFDEVVENIDIGGPTMLRSAAKNSGDVVVLTDPADYEKALSELEAGEVSRETRLYLMYKVYAHTAAYDSMISAYLAKKLGIDFPDSLTLAFEKKEQLRYGENPFQQAALYTDMFPVSNSIVNARQENGKQLSYNNLNDSNGAIELLKEFDEPTVVAVKHSNPCGVASGATIAEAYRKAYACDPVSIFGGIIAANREIDLETAEEISKIFVEIVIAPSFSEAALEALEKKHNLRVLALPDVAVKNKPTVEFKRVYGGLLVQNSDDKVFDDVQVVTKKRPTAEQTETMRFAMKVVKHCKSNAIVLAKGSATIWIGVGQTNRIWAAEQAIEHSNVPTEGAVLASDAFFPFDDCVTRAAQAGISAIVQPGGSIRDKDSILKADEHGIAMVFTGLRHFKH